MGLLVEGVWQDKWYDTKKTGGKFVRTNAQFRSWITADGGPGPDGQPGFKAEKGRYHLYVSYACPWAHRTLIFRKLKGLEDLISVSVVSPDMLEVGWTFEPYPASTEDHLYGSKCLHQIYTRAKSDYTGRVTVPILWDKQQETIVSNESSEIIRMFNTAFDDLGAKPGNYYPEDLRPAIDAINPKIYDNINNGVYKSGFATSQEAYEDAFDKLFNTLDEVEELLSGQRYLVGSRLTEADWRLFTTLVRFDPVYVGHFKCNLRRLQEYPNLWNYMLELCQHPGVAETINLDQIKRHYYVSQITINPTQVVPKGPEIDLTAPHNRDRFN